MGFADALREATPPIAGLAAIRLELDESDRAELDAALADPKNSSSAIAKALGEMGWTVGRSSVSEYRRRLK